MTLRHSERGASLVMLAITLFLLIGSAALAVDIAAIWADRSTDQRITDSAAAAGALEIAVGGTPRTTCKTAFAYVAANSREIASIDSSGCTTLPVACNPATASSLTVQNGRYDITVTYPVKDDNPLMTSGMVGATPQPLHKTDGSPCSRVGVEITSTRQGLFAQVLGFSEGRTTVHSVATSGKGSDQAPINLLVLDRHGCEAISVSGGGGIIVESIIDYDDNGNPIGLVPGMAAADSDGAAGCSNKGVISVDSNNAILRADGPSGCAGQVGTHAMGSYTVGEGCGKIQTYAPGTPGCGPKPLNMPACSPGGSTNKPKPDPTALPRPFTREKVDHRYNCFSDYTWTSANPGVSWATSALTVANEQNIRPCSDGKPAYIYDLIKNVKQTGTPTNLGLWTNLPASNCNVSPSTTLTLNGNYLVNCSSGFKVNGNVRINGNVVFNQDVAVGSGGHLMINNTAATPGWAFFRGGQLSKVAQGSLTLNYTMLYMSNSSSLSLAGGDNGGGLTWIAPIGGTFDSLALWSDSPQVHKWSGQANLVMEGVFFMPWATAEYTGGSNQKQTAAQWIARRLSAGGNSALVVAPADGRSVSFQGTGATLIR